MTTPATATELAVSAAIVTVAIVTVAKDRRQHLGRQFAGIDAQTRPPDEHIIIDLGGPPIDDRPLTTVMRWDVDGRALPVGEARNRGAAIADSDVLIFLDVDCVPTPGLVADYVDLVVEHPGIVCGPVGYLPALAPEVFFDGDGRLDTASLRAASSYQPGRPLPKEETRRSDRYELFWSLSFAVHRSTWNCLGGFDDAFDGYGGEDTDLAWTARSGGVELWFTGRAEAFHQHHAISTPPVEHLHDIVRNATVFHHKWGQWPMAGWLAEFNDLGLIDWTPTATHVALQPGLSTSFRSDSGR